jgi:hypothetical protein
VLLFRAGSGRVWTQAARAPLGRPAKAPIDDRHTPAYAGQNGSARLAASYDQVDLWTEKVIGPAHHTPSAVRAAPAARGDVTPRDRYPLEFDSPSRAQLKGRGRQIGSGSTLRAANRHTAQWHSIASIRQVVDRTPPSWRSLINGDQA